MSDDLHEQEDRLRAAIEAYHASALAYAAVKLGLPDRMGTRHWTAEELAAELSLSPPHLFRFLRGLVTIGICAESPERSFTLTSLGRSLAAGSPSRLGEKVMIVVEQYWRPWADLVSTLQTGAPAFEHVFGTDVWAWRNENFRGGDIFAAYLAGETFAGAGPIVEALDLSGAGSVADIGGGHGGLLAAILQAHPDKHGILFDLPETLIGARKFLTSHGVFDRVTLVGGDFLAEIPIEADLYMLKSVLQHWDDVAARAILEGCRDGMKARARLAIVERLLPEGAADDASAVMLDLHMMVISGGRVRTLQEFETLLKHAGLRVSKTTRTLSGFVIIEVVPVS
ncbi:methyltransferase [Methyloceanibacter sp.]|uniref:methyltransferase n=1 Tax=Methyloceanibacter sp. TaxID=1965321 RepID=UPI003D6D191C